MPLTGKSLFYYRKKNKDRPNQKTKQKKASLSSVSPSSPFWVEDVDQIFVIAARISVIFFLCGAWIRFTPNEKKEIKGQNSVIVVYFLPNCGVFLRV